MRRAKGPPKKAKDGFARIAPDLTGMLRTIRAHDACSVSDFLDPLIRPAITRRYQEVVKQMAAALNK